MGKSAGAIRRAKWAVNRPVALSCEAVSGRKRAQSRERAVPVLAALGAAAVLGVVLTAAAPPPAATHRVTVAADGAFTPAELRIHSGDTVEWVLPNRTTAIVASEAAPVGDACPAPRPFVPGDASNFTGPMPFAPSGVFVMGPLERGFREQPGQCVPGPEAARVGATALCATGAPFAAMTSTWADPGSTGVFIRLLWNRVHLAPGTDDASFDFTEMDREIDQAVRHGKLYSLGFKAGVDGTPAWIFSTPSERGVLAGRGASRGAGRGRLGRAGRGVATPPAPAVEGPNGGVPRLPLQDTGGRGRGCGVPMDLGSPTDPMYQKHYFDLLTKVAARIRARSDWYRALAYIKPSGANLVSHENRLPKNCETGCVCNPQVFAEAGYTPSGLYEFYRKQFALLAREFPDKAMAYALIQDGFPSVNDSGGWERPNGSSSNGRPLPGGVEQTERILDIGQREFGRTFVVQHNGLQPQPPAGTCPNEDRHPARGPYSRAGSGCPNRWVLEAGADGRTVTGLQTTNASQVDTPALVESTFNNAWVNSDASFVEIYEERFWEITHTNQGRLPSGRTLAAWADRFHERRRTLLRDLPDPFPRTHRHTFRLASGRSSETAWYFDPSTCGAGRVSVGRIVIER